MVPEQFHLVNYPKVLRFDQGSFPLIYSDSVFVYQSNVIEFPCL